MKKSVNIYFILLSFLVFSFHYSVAQVSIVKGRILNAETHKGVVQAGIQLYDEDGALITSISSGFNGMYQTDSLAAGFYYLSVKAAGFQEIEMMPLRLGERPSKIDLALVKVEDEKDEKSSNNGIGVILGDALKTVIKSNGL